MARNQVTKISFFVESEVQILASSLAEENTAEDIEGIILALDDALGDIDFTENLLRKFVEIVAKARKDIGEDFDINEFAPPEPEPVVPKVKQRKGVKGTQGVLL